MTRRLPAWVVVSTAAVKEDAHLVCVSVILCALRSPIANRQSPHRRRTGQGDYDLRSWSQMDGDLPKGVHWPEVTRLLGIAVWAAN